MAKRNYRQLLTGTGSCTNFCVNVCTSLFVVGVQQCINDCLACSGESGNVVFLSDTSVFGDDDDDDD